MIVRHSILNAAGFGVPFAAALIAIPILLARMGDTRFGALTLIWSIASYFGLLDLGLGRALTQRLSVLMAEQRENELISAIWVTIAPLVAAGTMLSITLWIIADLISAKLVGAELFYETSMATRILALGILPIVLTSGLRGALEARLAFGYVNLLRVMFGVYSFCCPLIIVLTWTSDLAVVASFLIAGRGVVFLLHVVFAVRLYPGLLGCPRITRDHMVPLFQTGGWLTCSNIISPLIAYLDRFYVGFSLGAAETARYATPQEMAARIGVLSVAVSSAAFPRFAAASVGSVLGGPDLQILSYKLIFATTLPLCSALWLFSPEILSLWINPDFAEESQWILRLMALMIFVASLGQIPGVYLQATGAVRVVALLQMIELPLYGLALWIAVSVAGLPGAAMVSLLRAVIDAAVLQAVADMRQDRRPLEDFVQLQTLLLLLAVIALFVSCLFDALAPRIIAFSIALAASARIGFDVLPSALRRRFFR